MDEELATIALTEQLLAPTTHPLHVGNLNITGFEEQVYVRQVFDVDDDLEKNVQWMLECREAQRNLLDKWLSPIVARFMPVFFFSGTTFLELIFLQGRVIFEIQ